jgi:hypothetical protein
MNTKTNKKEAIMSAFRLFVDLVTFIDQAVIGALFRLFFIMAYIIKPAKADVKMPFKASNTKNPR